MNKDGPLTEEQMRHNTIGELRPLSGRIVIADYDPRWPELYRGEADRIQAALQEGALRIEHTGSPPCQGLQRNRLSTCSSLLATHRMRPRRCLLWRASVMCHASIFRDWLRSNAEDRELYARRDHRTMPTLRKCPATPKSLYGDSAPNKHLSSSIANLYLARLAIHSNALPSIQELSSGLTARARSEFSPTKRQVQAVREGSSGCIHDGRA
jgi:hypothetical protein